MKTTEIFAKRLRELRNDNGISLKELAGSLDTTAQSLSLYERAERTINIDLIVKISKYFKVSTDYLLGLTDNKTNDITVKAICEYTGLNDKAVESLHGYLVYTPTEYRKEDFNSFEQYEEYNKIMLKHISLMAEIANDYIASDYFYYFLESIMDIKQNSAEWVEECKEGVRHNGQEFYNNEKTERLSKECDFAILNCNRWLDVFIQKYDNRYKNQKPMLLWEYLALNDIKKEVIVEMEAEQRGKHNPATK